jgi:hypothetical protein
MLPDCLPQKSVKDRRREQIDLPALRNVSTKLNFTFHRSAALPPSGNPLFIAAKPFRRPGIDFPARQSLSADLKFTFHADDALPPA